MPTSPRTQLKRKPERGHDDPATIRALLADSYLCHIAFSDELGIHCLPTACWPDADYLYIHGARNSRMLRQLQQGEAAVCISHLDGLVFARSAFHHSMNYRSLAIYGRFESVDDPAAKAAGLAALLEHLSPGRSQHCRPPTAAELAGTTLLRLSLAEAVAKIRNWGAVDSPEDQPLPYWAGVLPLTLTPGPLQPEPDSAPYPPPALPPGLQG